jgi:multidrug resistance efflux pump
MDRPRATRGPRRRSLRIVTAVVLGVVALVAITLGLRRLRVAAPAVERAAVWIEPVRRGPMLREVKGQGTLVPEDIRWITAVAAARVERILLRPGATVQADSVLVELVNPDLELRALEAARQLGAAEAELVNLMASLETQRLSQKSAVASLQSQLGDAQRRATADQDLSRRGFLSSLEMAQSRDRASELGGRLTFEKKRLGVQSRGIRAQIAAQRAQLERLRSIAAFRRGEVERLKVRAGIDGVLQELPLMPGQAVAAGTLLAKVARPERLKANIRVPETLAKDVLKGQRASLDTHNGLIAAVVTRVEPAVQDGTVLVELALEGPLVAGARPDLSVEGVIEIERLADALYVSRPAFGQPGTTVSLFRLDADGETAQRVAVKLGRSSVRTVEVTSGLREGDQVVLSDMSQWDAVDRVALR